MIDFNLNNACYKCARCEELKGLNEFHASCKGALGIKGTCKNCRRKQNNESYHRRKQKKLARSNADNIFTDLFNGDF